MTDFTQDPTLRHFYQAEMHHPFPEWVASSAIPTSADVEKNASASFADASRRLLPVHNPVAAFHSALDLMAHPEDYTEQIFDRVKKACSLFGITKDLEPYVEFFAGKIEKSAATSEPLVNYAIDEKFGDRDYQLFPIDTEEQIKDASYKLVNMAFENRLPYPFFYKAACRVYKAAENLNIVDDVHLQIAEAGVDRLIDKNLTLEKLAGRERFARFGDPELVREQYEEAVNETCVDKMICKIAAVDLVAGVPHKFRATAHVAMPHAIVKTGPLVSAIEKAARENVSIDDVLIPLAEIQKIQLRDAMFALSDPATQDLRKHASSDDAKDLSLAILDWAEGDKRQLMRLALQAA